MKNFIGFYDLAGQALTSSSDHKLTWGQIKTHTDTCYKKLSDMKFRLPQEGKPVIDKWMQEYNKEINDSFQSLNENIV